VLQSGYFSINTGGYFSINISMRTGLAGRLAPVEVGQGRQNTYPSRAGWVY